MQDHYFVPGSAWDETFRKLRFQLRASKQSFGGVRSQAEPGNEWTSAASAQTRGVLLVVIVAVGSAANPLDPVSVTEIPVDGFT